MLGLLVNRDKMFLIDYVKVYWMIGIELWNYIYVIFGWVNIDIRRRVNCYCYLVWFLFYFYVYGVILRLNVFVIVCLYWVMYVFSFDFWNGFFNVIVDNVFEFLINYFLSCWELKMCNFLINIYDRIGLFFFYKLVLLIFICLLKCIKFFIVVNVECM